ncbi:hypothetical protein V6R86_09575 [Sphingomonas kaistensis]|uniref:Tetratricopeptide repeat protein n=1 Tax=Sphingomonas kaistensis TaxID=298708 RepID=A0ABZ2G1D7_9SPHN
MAVDVDAGARRSWLSWIGLAAVLLLALQAGRSAFVEALGARKPQAAHTLWPSHPVPLTTLALAEIGAAARTLKPPPASALAQMREAGRVDPLAVEPLLTAAAERLSRGDRARGETLLKAALHREPRSTAAHFMLADLLIREGRVGDALANVAVLGRRLGGGRVDAFAGTLAVYLRDSGKVAEMRPVLDSNPELKKAVMTALAQDPAASPSLRLLTRPGDAGAPWFRTAFERQLGAGDLAGARGLLSAAKVGGGTSLTSWTDDKAGPLAWRLPTTPDGVAEAAPGGLLRLVYYGRNDTALADHLLLLPAGAYRFQAQYAGSPPAGSFEWRVTCLQGNRAIATWPANSVSSAQLIRVPADCPAQRLALWGRMGEFPRTVSAELLRVGLDPIQAGAAR